MTRGERLLVTGSTAAVALSGAAYAVFKHLFVNDDPFSAVNHPLQPWALRLHVVAAPVLVFAVGIMFKEHVLGRGRPAAAQGPEGTARPSRARSGAASIWLFGAAAATGYALPTLASGGVRDAAAWAHLGLGLVFGAAYGSHLLFRKRAGTEGAAAGLRRGAVSLAGPAGEIGGVSAGRLAERHERAAGARRAGSRGGNW